MDKRRSRTPIIITVNKGSAPQIDRADLQLKIYAQDGTPPTNPTYSFTKLAPADGYNDLSFNIGRFLKDSIEVLAPQNLTFVQSAPAEANSLVKKVGITTISYPNVLAVQTTSIYTLGYSEFTDGVNKELPTVLLDEGTYYYNNTTGNEIAPQVYFIRPNENDFKEYRWVNFKTGTATAWATIDVSLIGKLALIRSVNPAYRNDGNYLEFRNNATAVVWRGLFIPQKECKYTPFRVEFLNKYGVWFMTYFFKAKREAIDVDKETYNLKSGSFPTYSQTLGQRRMMNVNGVEKITLNTGFVPESYKDIIREMMLTEELLIDGKPAMIDSQSIEYQTSLVDGMINYTVSFKYRFDAVNSVQ
jgi:hypothetical protein